MCNNNNSVGDDGNQRHLKEKRDSVTGTSRWGMKWKWRNSEHQNTGIEEQMCIGRKHSLGKRTEKGRKWSCRKCNRRKRNLESQKGRTRNPEGK